MRQLIDNHEDYQLKLQLYQMKKIYKKLKRVRRY